MHRFLSIHRRPSRKDELIWTTVRKIPKGRVATYGRIAELAGFPRQARLVGYALHNLFPNSGVPWHRVINAQGKISLSDLNGTAARQKRLLMKEGIVFRKERIDLLRYGWPARLQRRRRK